jgi:hypothetical protein
MDDQTRRWIEDDIARLVVEYARLLDFGDRDGWLRLFPADGVLDLGFMRSSGQQELRQFLEGRSPRYTTAHVVSNIWVQVQDEDNATGTNYITAYRHVSPLEHAPRPVPMDPPLLMGYYDDRYTRRDGVWQFAERRLIRWFEREPGPGS